MAKIFNKNYLNNFLKTKIKAKTTISAAIPWSPRLFSKAIKLFVTFEPKKGTSGPNNIQR